ncbi:hypothetical protein J2Z76_001697 [Sedimentibacter acidaminivorans]|uniref:Transglutaminase-like domain-containing protein n=1 Tax=Sedimentibacter acidaminivorans TaxID=913099 RepID=A0ABS4GDQ2_9FIRM|nr:copper amine oxidase N-terminal domain-containing protein [Sedimentibacter acidaminivorans]MBP1925836.1 hypothetical protein [Sedimentibacter acidaminivorans]
MERFSFKIIVSVILMFMCIFSFTVYAVTYESSNINEFEDIILKELNLTNANFNITYYGEYEDIENIMKTILKKDPYLRCTITSIKWSTSSTINGVYNVNIKATHILSASKRNETDKKIDDILSDIIKPNISDDEKVKVVHDYIVKNSKYDTSSVFYSDYDLLTEGKSVCNGYALLTYNMLKKLNIPVEFVFGTSNSQSHVWNMVKLGEYWFHLDTTWNDPVPDRDNTSSYNYYMLTDEEITKDHVIEENQNLPLTKIKYYNYLSNLSKSKTNLKNYVYTNLLIETGLNIYDEENTAITIEELSRILKEKIKNHPSNISIRFSESITNDNVNSAMSSLFKIDSISEISYDQITKDNTGDYKVLNLYIKYKEIPDSITTNLSDKIYNTATKIDLNVYANYGTRKINITKDVMIHPYDSNFLNISGDSLTFNNCGTHNLIFEFEGKKAVVNITALNAKGFEYITDKKPDNSINVMVFNKYIDFSSINQWPFIDNNRTLVPIRAVFEVLNCNVEWNDQNNSAVVQHDSTKIVISPNSQIAYVNGIAKKLDAPAKLVNNRIMVPLRFISESINKTVIWDELNKTILIY